jgi:hypothetical protein
VSGRQAIDRRRFLGVPASAGVGAAAAPRGLFGSTQTGPGSGASGGRIDVHHGGCSAADLRAIDRDNAGRLVPRLKGQP